MTTHCVFNQTFFSPIYATTFDQMKSLAMEGVKKHWSRKITLGSTPYDVEINAVERASDLRGQPSVIYHFGEGTFNDRAYNSDTIGLGFGIFMHPTYDYEHEDGTIYVPANNGFFIMPTFSSAS